MQNRHVHEPNTTDSRARIMTTAIFHSPDIQMFTSTDHFALAVWPEYRRMGSRYNWRSFYCNTIGDLTKSKQTGIVFVERGNKGKWKNSFKKGIKHSKRRWEENNQILYFLCNSSTEARNTIMADFKFCKLREPMKNGVTSEAFRFSE